MGGWKQVGGRPIKPVIKAMKDWVAELGLQALLAMGLVGYRLASGGGWQPHEAPAGYCWPSLATASYCRQSEGTSGYCRQHAASSVSYTHLTLPTIYSV